MPLHSDKVDITVDSSSASIDDEVKEYHRWENITLTDFRSSNCWTAFSYFWLWFLAFKNLAANAADVYTTVILLAYKRWPGQIAPAIPFDVSRYLFPITLAVSFLLYAWAAWRARRVWRRGSVAKDYLDPLVATLQSMRSWRRFLVFAELTKSRKGADYVALFCYFQFKGAIRIILAEGPRQAINAITLYSVMKGDLINDGDNSVSLAQFAANVRILATTQSQHAVVLFTMLFSLIVWVFSALSLIAAALAYIGFLVHYIEGGKLTRYCKRKIEKRLRRIVEDTFQKELERQEARRRRAEERATRGGNGFLSRLGSRRTTADDLPDLPDSKGGEMEEIIEISNTLRHQPPSNVPYPRLPQDPPARAYRQPPTRMAPIGRGAARAPTLPTIVGSPRQSPMPFGRSVSNSSTVSQDSSDSDAPLIEPGRDPLEPAPLNIRRKPLPNLRGAIPVNPHPPPSRPMPERPPARLGPRPTGADTLPIPPPAPHSREAGGIGGPSTFAAMGL